MPSERRRIAVFGSSGYIGGRLVGYLSAEGCEVAPIARRQVNILDGSLSDLRAQIADCAAVVSLIGANENAAAHDPAAALNLSTVATQRIGEAVADNGVRRLVYFSTIHVYGTLSGEIGEGRPVAPIHPYGAAHAAAENVLESIAMERGLDTVILRLANSVGPPATPNVDRWTLVTNDLARTLAQTGRLQLRSAGLGWRDFIALSEVCRATLHALRLPVHKGLRVFNLGTGQARRVLDVAQRMAELAEPLVGKRPDLLRGPPDNAIQDAPPFALCVDALRRTAFEPALDIDDELRRLLQFALAHFGRDAVAR
jgi:UDP-glucose 4-epimerase